MCEISQDAFHDADPVCQHQRQPMTVTGFAVFESEAAECAAQPGGWRRGAERGCNIWPLVGMENLDICRLQRRTLPTVARVFAVVTIFHRVGWVVFWIGVHTPS